MNLNKVYLIGRLVSDPEYLTTTTGHDVTTLRLATNRVWTNPGGEKKEATEFHTVVSWGRLAQIANQYLQKGGLVMIEGRLQTRSWEDREGVKKYKTEIIAENLQLGPRFQGKPQTGLPGQGEPVEPFKPVAKKEEDDIPIINEGESLPNESSSAKAPDDTVEEAEIDIKEIPF